MLILDSGLFWLVVLLPLAGALLNIFLGRRISNLAVSVIACGSVGLSFLLGASALFFDLLTRPAGEQSVVLPAYTWIQSGGTTVDMALLADSLSLLMVLIVNGVGFLIHVYSIGYMWHDRDYPRFFVYLNLFIFAMLLLVLADSYPLLLVGWEGVGLCSYFLVSFWYEKKAPADAGVKAFVVNAIGDVGILIASFLCMVAFGSVSFQDVFTTAPQLYHSGDTFITLLTLCLVLGAVAKSAQIPLYTWLPDAMEGPTPVSALIHAATMVAAGVYLLVRSYPLLSLAPFTLETIAAIGAITLIFSATMGLAQTDIKRVLAYSTISQLGYMFLGVGVGGYVASMFHLTTHAFFKALLFLAAGSVIHAVGGEQDMRKMGGLRSRIPRTYWMLVIGALALMGFPLFSGFFSKDAILTETALSGHYVWYAVGLLTTFITAFYVFRLVFLTFWGRERLGREVSRHVHESPSNMLVPLYVLAFFAVFIGFLQLPGLHLFDDYLRPVMSRFPLAGAPAVAEPGFGAFLAFAGIAAMAGILGLALAYQMYVRDTEMPRRFALRYPGLYQAVYNKYYVDQAVDRVLVRPALGFSRWLTDLLDGTVVDGLVTALADGVRGTGNGLRRLQTGYVRQYALSFLLGAVVIAGFMISR